jgi:hypothetical protein
MAKVQDLLLEFVLRVDKIDEDGNVFTTSTIGVKDGQLTKQRQLDIYNRAREALYTALKETRFSVRLIEESGLLYTKSDLQFASGVATIPSDAMDIFSLTTSAGVRIYILPSPYEYLNDTGGVIKYVLKEGSTLRSPDTTTTCPNASNYILKYFKLPTYTLAQVVTANPQTTALAEEAFDKNMHPYIIELACALQSSQGLADVSKFAKVLLQTGKV